MNVKNFCHLFLVIIIEINKNVDIVLIWISDPQNKQGEFSDHKILSLQGLKIYNETYL